MKMSLTRSFLATALFSVASADGGLRGLEMVEEDWVPEPPTPDIPEILGDEQMANLCEYLPMTGTSKKHNFLKLYGYPKEGDSGWVKMMEDEPQKYFHPSHNYPDANYPDAQLPGESKAFKFELNTDCKLVDNSVVTGDPHFTQFDGHKFDFHGGCDMVLLQNPTYNNGQGMSIHIRTKIKSWWSYVESAVVKIGEETFEVKAGMEERQFWVNGEAGDKNLVARSGPMPFTIGGNKIRFRIRKAKEFQFKIFLDDDQEILLRSVEDLLRVEIAKPHINSFTGSLGLMGDFDKGGMVARDGTTVINDANEFGQEWQVRDSEGMLFHNVEGAQHPNICTMPSEEQVERRRLGVGTINREEAEEACSSAHPSEMEDCVEDVMASNDLDIAGAF